MWKFYYFLLYLGGRQMRYLAGTVYLNFSEWGFSWRGFSTLKDFFLYSLVFFRYLLLTLKTCTFIEDSPGNRSYQILQLFFDWSVNKIHWSTFVGRVPLPHIRFLLVIQSNYKIRAWLIKGPSPHLVGGVSLHINQNKNHRYDLTF